MSPKYHPRSATSKNSTPSVPIFLL